MAISWLLVGSGSEDPAAGLQPLVLREVRRGVLVGVWAHPLARRHANFFGKGVYFARDASYSTYPLYCEPDAKGSQTVFLVRVVTGEFCKGVKNALTPDLRNAAKNQLYDSTVDNVRDPSIFVTYHDAQAYPESARGVLASRRRRRGGGESIASRRSYRRGAVAMAPTPGRHRRAI